MGLFCLAPLGRASQAAPRFRSPRLGKGSASPFDPSVASSPRDSRSRTTTQPQGRRWSRRESSPHCSSGCVGRWFDFETPRLWPPPARSSSPRMAMPIRGPQSSSDCSLCFPPQQNPTHSGMSLRWISRRPPNEARRGVPALRRAEWSHGRRCVAGRRPRNAQNFRSGASRTHGAGMELVVSRRPACGRLAPVRPPVVARGATEEPPPVPRRQPGRRRGVGPPAEAPRCLCG